MFFFVEDQKLTDLSSNITKKITPIITNNNYNFD
ncbi:hypothetical protein FlaCF_1978 [Flavobacterium tructae]